MAQGQSAEPAFGLKRQTQKHHLAHRNTQRGSSIYRSQSSDHACINLGNPHPILTNLCMSSRSPTATARAHGGQLRSPGLSYRGEDQSRSMTCRRPVAPTEISSGGAAGGRSDLSTIAPVCRNVNSTTNWSSVLRCCRRLPEAGAVRMPYRYVKASGTICAIRMV
jgi:hypothetical protein